MDVETAVVASGVLPLERFAIEMHKSFPETLKYAAKGTVKWVIAITPPAGNGGNAGPLDSTSQAKARGISAINRDLNTLFVPVRLKHKRKERISGAEMVRLHQEALIRKRPGAKMRRATDQPLFVDAVKLRQLNKKLVLHVGRLAAGWMAAATALGYSPPAWIARHGTGRGTVTLKLTGSEMFIQAVNVPDKAPLWITTEAQRRVNEALRYEANGMNLQLQAMAVKRAQAAGMQATAA